MTRLFVAIGVLGMLATPARAQPLIHGADSVFATRDVVIVWAILRTTDERDTQVIIHVVTAPRFGALSVDAVDPFSGRREVVMSRRALSDQVDIRRRRAEFADLPRLEIQLHASDGPGAPALTVFYLGVPDTAPEFTAEAPLLRYLTDTSAKARRAD